ncbi:nucleotide exchange factor GrpE [Plectonema cf. radiosum LEGE 06105]|uniref:Nucleotide exchange factor GrpE n=1 Tax=Plectonema cf. radiosum LEGE 06105 TaxID=945769 RepID=A0A8J7K5P4_9CYAN|nr:nucleotide exchange factor GrpE [Plectonema radiosum]MBE9215277.1 nucleotide exchange factor GrpE [Plectonema cf. radiosum LEGE 06105]
MNFKTLFNRILALRDNTEKKYIINQELRDSIIDKIGILQKANIFLEQSLRTEKTQANATIEDLFLELLEVTDAFETLLNYLENNPEASPEFLQRLPKSIGAVHRKFLSILAKRQVLPIEVEETQLDFNLCRVVDREFRTDIPEKTITKVVRRGFYWGEKTLRPAEVIISKTDL